jgi:hypothetical protein
MSHERFKLTEYCKCGASMKGSGAGEPGIADSLASIFWSVHTDAEHGATDAKSAAAARRKRLFELVGSGS